MDESYKIKISLIDTFYSEAKPAIAKKSKFLFKIK